MEQTIFDRLRKMRPHKGESLGALIGKACDVGDELVVHLERTIRAIEIVDETFISFGGEGSPTQRAVAHQASAALARAYDSNGDSNGNGRSKAA